MLGSQHPPSSLISGDMPSADFGNEPPPPSILPPNRTTATSTATLSSISPVSLKGLRPPALPTPNPSCHRRPSTSEPNRDPARSPPVTVLQPHHRIDLSGEVPSHPSTINGKPPPSTTPAPPIPTIASRSPFISSNGSLHRNDFSGEIPSLHQCQPLHPPVRPLPTPSAPPPLPTPPSSTGPFAASTPPFLCLLS